MKYLPTEVPPEFLRSLTIGRSERQLRDETSTHTHPCTLEGVTNQINNSILLTPQG